MNPLLAACRRGWRASTEAALVVVAMRAANVGLWVSGAAELSGILLLALDASWDPSVTR